MTGIIPGMKEQMPLRASNNTSDQFIYKFNKVPTGWASQNVLCFHGLELTYVFFQPTYVIDWYYMGMPVDNTDTLVTIIPPTPTNILASAGWNTADNESVDNVMTIWTNFAKTGNPSITSGAYTFTLPAFTAASDTFVDIGTASTAAITVQTDFSTGY